MRELRTVLIIEDSETARTFIELCLQAFFPQVRSILTRNGFEALRALPSEDVDLIITDINMPDVNGLELIRFLKQHPAYRSIPIIVVSTERSPDDERRGLEAGASAYITKPFRPEHLAQVIREIWVRWETSRASSEEETS